MICWFLIGVAAGLFLTSRIAESNQIYEFKEYGVAKHASFNFEIVGNVTNALILIAKNTDIQTQKLQAPSRICVSPESGLPYAYRRFRTTNGTYSWTGTVKSDGTYYPTVFNCARETFNISMTFRNFNSCLDAREQSIPYLYGVLSFLYPTLTVIWILNAAAFSKFDVPIHKLFTLTTVVRAVAIIMTSNLWVSKTIREIPDSDTVIYADIATFVANIFLFSVNGLAGLGWNSFRHHLTFKEVFRTIFIVTGFFLVRWFMKYTDSIFYDLLLISLMVILALCYLYVLGKGIKAALSLTNRYQEDCNMAGKTTLVIQFGMYITIWMSISYMIGMCVYIMTDLKSVKYVAEEVIYLMITVLDMVFFFLREKYKPVITDEGTLIHMANLIEPDQLCASVLITQ